MATPKDELEPSAEQKAEHARREKAAAKLNAKAPDPREDLAEEPAGETAPPAPTAPQSAPKKKR